MSRGGLGVAGALVGGIVLGVVFSPAPVPKTRFITVHQAPETIIQKEVETKIVNQPTPESCATALDIAAHLAPLASKVHRNNEKAYDKFESLDYDSLDDPDANVKLLIWLNDKQQVSSRDLWAMLELNEALDLYVRTCDEDKEAVANGEEVKFSDGQPFPVSGLY